MGLKTVKEMAHTLREHGGAQGVQTLVEVVGDRRVLVEHHRGILVYGTQEISVGATFGVLRVSGCGLRLCCMNREQLFISGQIQSIALESGRH